MLDALFSQLYFGPSLHTLQCVLLITVKFNKNHDMATDRTVVSDSICTFRKQEKVVSVSSIFI